jgi:hypothetical protein
MTLPFKNTGSIISKIILLVVVAAAALIVKFGYHECWKDEWQAWLMARDMGWGELYAALFYEGHPAIWYYYLKIWTVIQSATGIAEESILHFSHWLVAVAAWAVFTFKFRLPIWVKALVLFGYYVFFEYGILDRGYAFVMLFGFLSVLAVEKADEKPLRFAGLLFLLCQTEVFGVLMAGGIFFYYLLKKLDANKLAQTLKIRSFQKVFAGIAAGVIFFVITVFPRGQHEELGRAYTNQPFSTENIATAFQGDFANTFLIGLIKDTNVFGVSALGISLSVVVLGALIYFFWASRKTLWTFLVFTGVFFLFGIAIFPGGVRQWGMYFIFFLIGLQLYGYEKKELQWPQMAILILFLAVQVQYNIRALEKDIKFPFTNAELAANFIREKVPENVPIVAINKFANAPVTGYAGRAFYQMPSGEPFTYFKWLEKVYLPTEAELKLFAEFKGVGGIVIISDKQLPPERYPNVELWQSFDSYNVKNENYYLYALQR